MAVASSVRDAPALERARSRGVATEVFARDSYADRGDRDEALAQWLLGQGARLVVLAGYMELLGGPFLERFPRAVINVHPSLLPSFPACGQSTRRSPTGSRCSASPSTWSTRVSTRGR